MDEIRPSMKGALLVQGAKSLAPFVLIAAIYLMMRALGIIKILSETKEGLLGFFPSFQGMLTQFIAIVAFAVVAILLVILMGVRNTRYVFAPDRIVAYGGIVSEGANAEIPYASISRVTMVKYPLMDVGKIMLELSGVEKQKFEMDFMGNPAGVSQFIEAMRR